MPPPYSPSERPTRPGRIDARPKNPRYMSGLNTFYALQNRNAPAFSDPRRPGMSAREIGEDAASMGYTIGAQGLRPSYMPNNPQGPMTAEQLRQRNLDTAKANRSFARIRREFNARGSGKRMNNRGDIIDVEVKEKATSPPPKPDGTLAGAAGVDLEKLRPDFSAAKGTDTPTPSAPVTAAQRRQMLADAASGRSESRVGDRVAGISSGYGSGSSRLLKPGEGRPVPMTTDEFGKPETMKSFLERRKAIQKSKGMS